MKNNDGGFLFFMRMCIVLGVLLLAGSVAAVIIGVML